MKQSWTIEDQTRKMGCRVNHGLLDHENQAVKRGDRYFCQIEGASVGTRKYAPWATGYGPTPNIARLRLVKSIRGKYLFTHANSPRQRRWHVPKHLAA